MKDKAKTEGKLDNIIDSVTKRNLTILGEETTLGLTIKSLVTIAIVVASFVGLYYRLDARISTNAELGVKLPEPVVKKEIHDIKLQMNRIEDRLYEIKVSR